MAGLSGAGALIGDNKVAGAAFGLGLGATITNPAVIRAIMIKSQKGFGVGKALKGAKGKVSEKLGNTKAIKSLQKLIDKEGVKEATGRAIGGRAVLNQLSE